MIKKYLASVSFGKDSLCMLLKILESPDRFPLDEVIFYNTGMEFDCILHLRDQVCKMLQERGIPFVELHPSVPFWEKMLCSEVISEDGSVHYGYDWCGGGCRWATNDKVSACNKYCKKWPPGTKVYQYIGIAADELSRVTDDEFKIYPLVELGLTEKDCLEYCYAHGFYWEENGILIYSVLDRVSCWCCKNKNLKELRNIYRYLPRYWKRLKGLQSRIARPFYQEIDLFTLEKRFQMEQRLWYTVYDVVFASGVHERIGLFGDMTKQDVEELSEEMGQPVTEVFVLTNTFQKIMKLEKFS